MKGESEMVRLHVHNNNNNNKGGGEMNVTVCNV